MKKLFCLILMLFAGGTFTPAKTLTYIKLDTVNLRDRGIPADEHSTNVLVESGNFVYSAASGDKCSVFRFEPQTQKITILTTIDGLNNIMKGTKGEK